MVSLLGIPLRSLLASPVLSPLVHGQIDGMTALTLARRQGKSEVVALLEASTERRKSGVSEQRGVWSGKLGQAY